MNLLEQAVEHLWSPWLLGAFLVIGLYFSVGSGWFQIFGIRRWMGSVLGGFSKGRTQIEGGLTQFQAVATALAATVGTGSIAGVATAIFYGGPGAVFWMWICALLGMMIGFAEKTLAVRWRVRENGEWKGGPMEYMERGLKAKPLAIWYAIAVTVASLGGGGMVQANSVAVGLSDALGWSRWLIGAITVAVTGMVILGGIGRIGRVCEWLTPLMTMLFLLGGGVILFYHRQAFFPALRSIVNEAFAPRPAVGGGFGYGMMTAMRYGVARGVFTNEAGLGTSSMAHAQAAVKDPAEQGMWGIFEVFFSTLVICTVSAMVILTSGVYDKVIALTYIQNGNIPESEVGVPMASRAFETVLGNWGSALVTLCLLLFAFSSLLGWSYYGERGLSYLLGRQRGKTGFRFLFLAAVFLGSVSEVRVVWQLSDLCNAMMALPNLMALLLLSPEVFCTLKQWTEKGRKC